MAPESPVGTHGEQYVGVGIAPEPERALLVLTRRP
jgi:hypothetical protein